MTKKIGYFDLVDQVVAAIEAGEYERGKQPHPSGQEREVIIVTGAGVASDFPDVDAGVMTTPEMDQYSNVTSLIGEVLIRQFPEHLRPAPSDAHISGAVCFGGHVHFAIHPPSSDWKIDPQALRAEVERVKGLFRGEVGSSKVADTDHFPIMLGPMSDEDLKTFQFILPRIQRFTSADTDFGELMIMEAPVKDGSGAAIMVDYEQYRQMFLHETQFSPVRPVETSPGPSSSSGGAPPPAPDSSIH